MSGEGCGKERAAPLSQAVIAKYNLFSIIMKKTIQQDIMELRNTLVVASLNYEIWWFYKEKDNRKKFIDTLRIYKPFFEISLHAHFVAMIIAIYKLFETRSDTVNMHQLIGLLKEEGVIPQRKIQKIESKIKEINYPAASGRGMKGE